jgi:DNA-binding NarL/FixJ family response regulator
MINVESRIYSEGRSATIENKQVSDETIRETIRDGKPIREGDADNYGDLTIQEQAIEASPHLRRQMAGGRSGLVAEGKSSSIVIIESNRLIGGCIAKAVSASFPCEVSIFSTTDEFVQDRRALRAKVVMLSSSSPSGRSVQHDLELIAGRTPGSRTIVIGEKDDPDGALFAIGFGAKGYIPTTMGWDVVVEAIRIVLAGGTYIPVKYIVALHSASVATRRSVAPVSVTERELTVLRAIQQGKPNKSIAFDLNLRESTVKVHVRHIMSKFHVRNRTELAVRSAEILGHDRR